MHTIRQKGMLALMLGGVLAATALMAGPAQAQATSNGPYYALPSWDQTLPSATRFIILSNFASQAVLDRNTGLVWERSPAATAETWNSARFTCLNKTVGGQKGFRLPSIVELTSLVDPANNNPALPAGHPFTNVLSSNYWSATTFAENPANAWFVNFNFGNVFSASKASSGQVWCVRGGSNADAY